jgi:hypothetical protein
MARNPGDHDVYIISDTDENGEQYFRVVPAVAMVKDSVTFRNMTGYKVTVDITNGSWLDHTGNVLQADSKNITFKFDANFSGPVDYAVSVDRDKGKTVRAIAGSDPKIIVDA